MDKTLTLKKRELLKLFYYVDPYVLRSHREIFEWLEMSLKKIKAHVYTEPRGLEFVCTLRVHQ